MKRVQIYERFDYQGIVIGIASDERIWKVCFEINESLAVNLKENTRNYDILLNEVDTDSPDPSLFHATESPQENRPVLFYEDVETNEDCAFYLFKPEATGLPKEIRSFRYLLAIQALTPSLPEPANILEKLNKLTTVRSAVDISHIKSIKHLLP